MSEPKPKSRNILNTVGGLGATSLALILFASGCVDTDKVGCESDLEAYRNGSAQYSFVVQACIDAGKLPADAMQPTPTRTPGVPTLSADQMRDWQAYVGHPTMTPIAPTATERPNSFATSMAMQRELDALLEAQRTITTLAPRCRTREQLCR